MDLLTLLFLSTPRVILVVVAVAIAAAVAFVVALVVAVVLVMVADSPALPYLLPVS